MIIKFRISLCIYVIICFLTLLCYNIVILLFEYSSDFDGYIRPVYVKVIAHVTLSISDIYRYGKYRYSMLYDNRQI